MKIRVGRINRPGFRFATFVARLCAVDQDIEKHRALRLINKLQAEGFGARQATSGILYLFGSKSSRTWQGARRLIAWIKYFADGPEGDVSLIDYCAAIVHHYNDTADSPA